MGRHGESIWKRQDGRWEARLLTGYDSDGKAKYKYIYGKSYMEAKEKRMKAAERLEKNAADTDRHRKMTLQEVAQEWLAQQEGHIKESSYTRYTNLLANQIIPALGHCRIAELNKAQFDSFFKAKLAEGKLNGKGGLSPKYVADMRVLLAQMMAYAREQNYCTGSAKVPTVSVRSGPIDVLTPGEQKKLEAVMFGSSLPVCLGMMLSLYAGLRIGEVCALQWGDIDFTEGTLHVGKTVSRIRDFSPDAPARTKLIVQVPKTQCSIRTIPLPDFLAEQLWERRKQPQSYILTGTENCMDTRTCLKKYKRVLKEAGVADHTWHILRHTFATRCVESGFDMKSLSEIMGHASVTITMERYVHPSMDMKRQQMNRLRKL